MEGFDVVGFISDVGFPICMCVCLLWYLVESNKTHKENVSVMSKSLTDNNRVIENLTKSLEANTRVIEEMSNRISDNV